MMKKTYVKALDAMRAIAIAAVVMIHTTTRTIETAKDNVVVFPWTLFLNQISRFAVPLFFIVSGFALELNYSNNTNYLEYLKKRLGKIFVPYVFWSAIYYLFIYNQNHDNFFQVLYLGNASYQLYFIPTLFIFYLIFPVLHKMYGFLANKWVLLVLIFSQMFILHQDYFVKPYHLDDPIHTAILCYFVFILGMMAARNKDSILIFAKKIKYLLMFSVVVLGFYIFFEGILGFIKTFNYLTFYSNFRPSTLIYSVLVALILYYLFDKSHFVSSPRKALSNASFFIFFVHVIILEEVWTLFGHSLFNSMTNSVTGRIIFDPLFFGVVFGISFLLAFLIRKIPFASKITG